MHFGMFLVKRGVITADQLMQVMEMQNEQLLPLGVIAIEEGKLAVRDVLSVLRVQSDLPYDRFGDIAVELGLLTRRDVAELLMLQSDRLPTIGECLVTLGILEREVVDDELGAFRRDRERGGAARVQRVFTALSKYSADDVKKLAANS